MDALSGTLAYGWQHPLLSAAYLVLASTASFILYFAALTCIRPFTSSLRDVRRPRSESWLFGVLPMILEEEPGKSHVRWMDEYGGAVRYKGFLGEQRLVIYDPLALNHVLLSNAYDYPKPEEVRGELAQILGKGVLFAEGDDHRRQRRIMQPAFGAGHLRELVPVFFERANKLRDIWTDAIAAGTGDEAAWKDTTVAKAYEAQRPDGEVTFELVRWLNRLTLDIIGITGFGYHFNALEQEDNKLGKAFSTMFSPRSLAKRHKPRNILIFRIVGFLIRALPILKVASWIPNKRIREVNEGFRALDEESVKIIRSKEDAVEKDGLDSIRGSKDLIALLLKSAGSDSKASMTTAELRGQLTTFLLAGHETTSTALTWTLYHLSQHPEKQDRLRNEVREARRKALAEGRDELESAELDALAYLDAVAREILRLEAPVTATIRRAGHEDHIPLSRPLPSARDPSKTISSLHVKEGQTIFIPILAVNKNKQVFGEDAEEFRPERWIESEEEGGRKIEGGVGVWAHMLTFLTGPRSCIGYRFALLELKAILSVLIDAFDFSLRDGGFKIERRSQIVTRPLIIGEEESGPRMPLRVKLAQREV
ncbi:hypothetical protein JCM6882_001009 [Rhodosporidiobolus microsporus]